MKKLLIVLFLLPTLGLITSSYIIKKDKELKIGKPVPALDVKMNAVDDNSYALSDLKGEKGLVVVFSCNSCPFVVGNDDFAGWEVQYNDLYEKAQAAGLGFVLVNSNEAKRDGADSMEKMKEHAEAAAYKMNYLVDENSAVANAFGAKTTPHIYVIDANKKLAFRGSIDNSWDSERAVAENYLLDVIGHFEKGSKPKVTTSDPRGCSIKRK